MSATTIRSVTITVASPPSAEALLLLPRPFDHWGQRLHGVAIEGIAAVSEIGAASSACRAYLVQPAGETVRIRYELVQDRLSPAAAFVWDVAPNRYTEADVALARHARELTAGAPDQRTALTRLIADAEGCFGYGHGEDGRFNDGHACVPLVCGTTRGTCVDINTYILAGARSIGIKGQYVAGYWFHPDHVRTPDMHCWLVFAPDGTDGLSADEVVFWDLAHCLKWGAEIGPGLNPAGGRRVAMSCGRGLAFDTPHGRATISHFSEPAWILPGGADVEADDLTIDVTDPAGDRSQYPA